MPKVALGLSGGVDSALSAYLLKEAGYDVTAIYLECWRAPGCRTEEDRKDALNIALELNIPFQVLDFKDAYRQRVVEYFFDEYEAGRTPNPDVMCNKEIKFGLFYDWAMANHFDFVATGHYAQLRNGQLIGSADMHKDQTYFLYRLRKDQLKHILFPIGHLLKKEVRTEAVRRDIPVASKKDSVGICFIGDINVHSFLKERLGEKPGQVVDTRGHIIGEHRGLWFYTVGQRHGFTVQPITSIEQSDHSFVDKHNIPPFYIIKKIPEKNQLVVGFGAETFEKEFFVDDYHWIDQPPTEDQKLFVRIRHTGTLHECRIDDQKVTLQEAIQGIAEGQSAVFYTQKTNKEYMCLGGAIIQS